MHGSYSFLEAAKLGDAKTCKLLLSRNENFVYNFDYVISPTLDLLSVLLDPSNCTSLCSEKQ